MVHFPKEGISHDGEASRQKKEGFSMPNIQPNRLQSLDGQTKVDYETSNFAGEHVLNLTQRPGPTRHFAGLTTGQLQSEIGSLKRQLDRREQVTKALSGMATCSKAVTATITGALTSIVFAGGLAAGFAGPAAATECPAGAPVPYGLIGDTWRTVDRHQAAISGIVKDRIGCPIEPEHGVPGLNGRLQTFQNGQIAWTPDQGPSMTIWAIRDKAHFRVQWSTNDNWSYDSYLIRWDRDGQNIGQREISGTVDGWWDFDFDTPGRYTFIVEGRSGGGYHHGWTIPVGGTVPPRDIPPPNVPAKGPLPPAPPPTISATTEGRGAGTILVVTGSGFLHDKAVTVRVVDDVFHERNFPEKSTALGGLNVRIPLPCNGGLPFHVSATDSRPAPGILGVVFSNNFTSTCP